MKINEMCKGNRELLGLSIEEISLSLGLKSDDYSKFEKGENVFDKKDVIRILKALYVNAKDYEIEEFDDSLMDEEERRITEISLRVIKECEAGEDK